MGAMSRNKGKAGELEVVHVLRAHGWDGAERTSDGRNQNTRGDIRRGPEAVHFEVRRKENLRLWEALEDALTGAKEHDLPVLAFRRNRSRWYAAIPLDDLLELLRLREAA